MRRAVFFLILLFNLGIFAGQKPNPFEEAEKGTNSQNTTPLNDNKPNEADKGGSGPPGDDDLPINDYLPFLLITGVAIIGLIKVKQQKLQNKNA